MNSRFRNIVDSRCSGKLMTPGLIVIFLCLLVLFPFTGLHGMEKGDPARGERSFNKRSCAFCHTLKGRGGDIGPDLTNIKQRHSEEWLFKWLKDPHSIKPGTIMPIISWTSDQEIYDVISYLTSSGGDSGKPSGKEDEK
ncbi:MAG: c-type cytochrome [Nitrospirota bacterium]